MTSCQYNPHLDFSDRLQGKMFILAVGETYGEIITYSYNDTSAELLEFNSDDYLSNVKCENKVVLSIAIICNFPKLNALELKREEINSLSNSSIDRASDHFNYKGKLLIRVHVITGDLESNYYVKAKREDDILNVFFFIDDYHIKDVSAGGELATLLAILHEIGHVRQAINNKMLDRPSEEVEFEADYISYCLVTELFELDGVSIDVEGEYSKTGTVFDKKHKNKQLEYSAIGYNVFLRHLLEYFKIESFQLKKGAHKEFEKSCVPLLA